MNPSSYRHQQHHRPSLISFTHRTAPSDSLFPSQEHQPPIQESRAARLICFHRKHQHPPILFIQRRSTTAAQGAKPFPLLFFLFNRASQQLQQFFFFFPIPSSTSTHSDRYLPLCFFYRSARTSKQSLPTRSHNSHSCSSPKSRSKSTEASIASSHEHKIEAWPATAAAPCCAAGAGAMRRGRAQLRQAGVAGRVHVAGSIATVAAALERHLAVPLSSTSPATCSVLDAGGELHTKSSRPPCIQHHHDPDRPNAGPLHARNLFDPMPEPQAVTVLLPLRQVVAAVDNNDTYTDGHTMDELVAAEPRGPQAATLVAGRVRRNA